mgnify:CR=1 FL=1
MTPDTDTIVDQLSSLLTSTLTSLQTPEFLEFKSDLTSLTHTVTSLEQEMTAALSAVPLHPYERLKYDYFGADYVFKKFEDVEEVDDIPLDNCLEYIKNKNKELWFGHEELYYIYKNFIYKHSSNYIYSIKKFCNEILKNPSITIKRKGLQKTHKDYKKGKDNRIPGKLIKFNEDYINFINTNLKN